MLEHEVVFLEGVLLPFVSGEIVLCVFDCPSYRVVRSGLVIGVNRVVGVIMDERRSRLCWLGLLGYWDVYIFDDDKNSNACQDDDEADE